MTAERILLCILLAFAPLGDARAIVTCVVGGASMSLGTYIGDTSAPSDAIGTFTLTCTRNGAPPSITVTMSIGASANSGSIANRQLRLATGTDLLSYNLYRDASRLQVWGDTVGVNTQSQAVSLPNKVPTGITFNIYGRIPGLQDVRAGSYFDSLVVTVAY